MRGAPPSKKPIKKGSHLLGGGVAVLRTLVLYQVQCCLACEAAGDEGYILPVIPAHHHTTQPARDPTLASDDTINTSLDPGRCLSAMSRNIIFE